jgi:hypothetical protein
MDPVKVTGVADWSTPTNKKEVQFFVRFINFYCRFISDFSHHARTLFDLTIKDVRFIWGLPQEDFLMKLKELVTSSPILVLPNNDLPFRLKADGFGCKGTSICFLTSPILSHSPPIYMYSPSSPLYYLQEPYLKPTTSRPDGLMTFQKSTH